MLCHDAARQGIVGCDSYPIPDLQECIDLNIRLGSLANPNIKCVGVAVNTSSLSGQEAQTYCVEQGKRLQLPVVAPVRIGVAAIVDKLEQEYQ